MVNKKKRYVEVFSVLVLTVLLCSLVAAFGLSPPFSEDNPLTVYPGETKDTFIQLKAGAEDGDLTIKAELLDAGGVATLIDSSTEYSVPPSDPEGVNVNLRLNIPATAAIGTEYEVQLKFTDITPGDDGGTVGFQSGSIITLRPKVIARPPEETPEELSMWWIVIAVIIVIVLIIVIYFVVKNRKISTESVK